MGALACRRAYRRPRPRYESVTRARPAPQMPHERREPGRGRRQHLGRGVALAEEHGVVGGGEFHAVGGVATAGKRRLLPRYGLCHVRTFHMLCASRWMNFRDSMTPNAAFSTLRRTC